MSKTQTTASEGLTVAGSVQQTIEKGELKWGAGVGEGGGDQNHVLGAVGGHVKRVGPHWGPHGGSRQVGLG